MTLSTLPEYLYPLYEVGCHLFKFCELSTLPSPQCPILPEFFSVPRLLLTSHGKSYFNHSLKFISLCPWGLPGEVLILSLYIYVTFNPLNSDDTDFILFCKLLLQTSNVILILQPANLFFGFLQISPHCAPLNLSKFLYHLQYLGLPS